MIYLHNFLGVRLNMTLLSLQSLDYAMNQPVVVKWGIVCHISRHNVCEFDLN